MLHLSLSHTQTRLLEVEAFAEQQMKDRFQLEEEKALLEVGISGGIMLGTLPPAASSYFPYTSSCIQSNVLVRRPFRRLQSELQDAEERMAAHDFQSHHGQIATLWMRVAAKADANQALGEQLEKASKVRLSSPSSKHVTAKHEAVALEPCCLGPY